VGQRARARSGVFVGARASALTYDWLQRARSQSSTSKSPIRFPLSRTNSVNHEWTPMNTNGNAVTERDLQTVIE
jgi:hypothetical protein